MYVVWVNIVWSIIFLLLILISSTMCSEGSHFLGSEPEVLWGTKDVKVEHLIEAWKNAQNLHTIL